VTLIEASELLGNFDHKLREYAARTLVKQGVHLMKGLVKEVRETSLTLADGQVLHMPEPWSYIPAS
jgi:NADH:ubiquinone reductase (non-electrogenic)